jgi:hypothetical protein
LSEDSVASLAQTFENAFHTLLSFLLPCVGLYPEEMEASSIKKAGELGVHPLVRYNAEGGSRTHMGVTRASLSRLRLPIPPLRPGNKYS